MVERKHFIDLFQNGKAIEMDDGQLEIPTKLAALIGKLYYDTNMGSLPSNVMRHPEECCVHE